MAKQAAGDDRNWNGCSHCEPGLEAYIDGDATENDAKDCAQQYGAQGEFRTVFTGRDKGLKVGHWQPPNDCL